MFNTSNATSGGPRFKHCPSHYFLRQGTLLSSARPQLFKGWITLWIYPVNNEIGYPDTYLLDIVIYPLDSTI